MVTTLHVATRKGLFRFDRRGAGWVAAPVAFLGVPVSAFLVDERDDTLYAALNHGHFGVKLHRSEDAGATWRELPAPAFPPDPAAGEAAPTVEMIWTLAAAGADQPGVLWAGTLPGALFRLSDRGEAHVLTEALWNMPERPHWFGGGYDSPGIHSVHVDPRDSRRLTAGISCGGIWKSDDGGATWRLAGRGLQADYMPEAKADDPAVQDPHRLAHCPANPDRVWCQHHSGIFRSDDGGWTFTRITGVAPSSFGFAVAVHPAAPDTAWFVPAVKDECRVPVDGRLLVIRTLDGGRSFESLGEGLPGSGCYDLVYRHGLAASSDGGCLAMGSTTGNLWWSDDAGTSWARVSGHLPPIYQVSLR